MSALIKLDSTITYFYVFEGLLHFVLSALIGYNMGTKKIIFNYTI